MSLKSRLIPILLLKNGLLVRSQGFATHQIIGNPFNEVARFSEWCVDELIYLDISREGEPDLQRDDLKANDCGNFLSILEEVSRTCFMPLTVGGGIRTIEDMRARFHRGADKVTLNTLALEQPNLVDEAAGIFGAQALVLSVDARRRGPGDYEVMAHCGQLATGRRVEDWAREMEARGIGEILLQSVDRDGEGKGYDLELIECVSACVEVPVICCSGVGRFEDYAPGIKAGAAAVAAANIWHFKELSDRQGKRALAQAGVDVRKVGLGQPRRSRTPNRRRRLPSRSQPATHNWNALATEGLIA